MTGDLLPTPELYHLPGFHDPFSAISHLVGAVAFVGLGILLLRRGRGDAMRLVYLGIYSAACVFLLSMSAVYHMLEQGGTARQVLARLDHSAIFVLIAGTFTPCYGILHRGWERWVPLLFVWTCAITGLTLKTIFFTDMAEVVGLAFYLGLGWFGSLTSFGLWRRYGWRFVEPVVFGGLAYTVGGLIEYLRLGHVIPGVIHPHELFHVLVLVGVGFHWWFIWQIAPGRAAVEMQLAQNSRSEPGRARSQD